MEKAGLEYRDYYRDFEAKEYAESALKLATCDGPPYYYKVAYDEAVAMLERLKV